MAPNRKNWASATWNQMTVIDVIGKSAEMVRVQSNDNSEKFEAAVHKELLCFFSRYYNAAIKGEFAEAGEEVFTLELNKYHTKIFVSWLYTGHIADDDNHTYPDLVDIYIFADKFDFLALRRSIMTEMDGMFGDRNNAEYAVIPKAFTLLPGSSPLRRYFVDQHTHHWEPDIDGEVNAENHDSANTELLYRAMYNVVGQKGKRASPCTCCDNQCEYHEHESRDEWWATCGSLPGPYIGMPKGLA